MISKITGSLFLAEFSDVVGSTDAETESHLIQLTILGITDVLSLCNDGVESCLINKEVNVFEVSPKGKIKVHLHHQSVPVDIEVAGRHDAYQVGFQLAIKKIHNIFYNNPKAVLLIHCVGGVDRSPFLLATYLARSRHIDIADAYKIIKKNRSHVVEHLEWVWWSKSPPSVQIQKEQVS